jgi:hypothetical protein
MNNYEFHLDALDVEPNLDFLNDIINDDDDMAQKYQYAYYPPMASNMYHAMQGFKSMTMQDYVHQYQLGPTSGVHVPSLDYRPEFGDHGYPDQLNYAPMVRANEYSVPPSHGRPHYHEEYEKTEPLDLDSGIDTSYFIEEDIPTTQRTIYFGNVPNLSVSNFMTFVRGGMIESVKYLEARKCLFVTFVDAKDAHRCFQFFMNSTGAISVSQQSELSNEQCQGIFLFENEQIKIGWGNESSCPTVLSNHIKRGATRCVYISNLDEKLLEDSILEKVCGEFGPVESVKIVKDKRIGFVHMMSITNAVRAVQSLGDREGWKDRKVFYGRDRACDGFLPLPVGNATITLPLPSTEGTGELRTIYIGGSPPSCSLKDICDVRRFNVGFAEHWPN